jgi:transmembrane sensor
MKTPGETSWGAPSTPDRTQDGGARSWVLYFASGEVSLEQEQAFAAWLAESEANRLAFDRAWRLWDGLADVAQIEDILADRDNIKTFQPRPVTTRRLLLGGGLAASLAYAAGIGLMARQPAPTQDILLATPRGEIKTFTLPEGSEITLGGASRVRGEFTARKRTLQLVDGNAFFDIAHDESRPLTVDSGGVLVRVLGTRFDIKKRGGQVSVSVDRGHVQVMAEAAAVARDLRAGERILSTAALPLGAVQSFDSETELSWRSGRLAFVDAPLRDIVADMNQYSDRPVRLAPGAPADMRLTLSFSIGQIGQVLAGLDAAYPIDVRDNGTEIVIANGL